MFKESVDQGPVNSMMFNADFLLFKKFNKGEGYIILAYDPTDFKLEPDVNVSSEYKSLSLQEKNLSMYLNFDIKASENLDKATPGIICENKHGQVVYTSTGKKLGEGAFGKVFLLEQNSTIIPRNPQFPQFLSLKLTSDSIRDSNVDGDETKSLVTVINSRSFPCSNVVKYNVMKYFLGGQYWITMILMPYLNNTLTNYKKEISRLSIGDRYIFARYILITLLREIECLWRKGYVYADIKEDNILLNITGTKEITDILLGDIELCGFNAQKCAMTASKNMFVNVEDSLTLSFLQCILVFLRLLHDRDSLHKCKASNFNVELECKIIDHIKMLKGDGVDEHIVRRLIEFFQEKKYFIDCTSSHLINRCINELTTILPSRLPGNRSCELGMIKGQYIC